MIYNFSCRDAGIDCDFTATSNSISSIIEKISKHGKERHGIAEEEINALIWERDNSASII